MRILRVSAAAVLSALAAVAMAMPAANATVTERNQPCPTGYVCLYEHSDFNRHADGRMLKWNESGRKELGDWNFREKTSSIRDKRTGGFKVTDVRTGLPDRHLDLNGDYSQLPSGWNDDIDRLELP
ncbi:Peptidase inhibitor family I36 [Lentzea fradiae]|uniref:Peptidase inhibitor family I36 n=1 Tax=Lentzea fradiae TaxID=200378 RepID=A0A1G7VN20_9PSEU|nr:peptidase inhibitor family I36 protein [Lentzea fradiae]SDG61124.1 Peptidase inhibitor family I36 [Lentzea fradiae]